MKAEIYNPFEQGVKEPLDRILCDKEQLERLQTMRGVYKTIRKLLTITEEVQRDRSASILSIMEVSGMARTIFADQRLEQVAEYLKYSVAEVQKLLDQVNDQLDEIQEKVDTIDELESEVADLKEQVEKLEAERDQKEQEDDD